MGGTPIESKRVPANRLILYIPSKHVFVNLTMYSGISNMYVIRHLFFSKLDK